MELKANPLSQDEMQRVHEESLRILAQVGVRFYGEMAAKLLAQHGVEIDADKGIAKIQPEMVSWALEKAPKSFILGARNSQYNFPLPSPFTRCCIDGTAAFAQDFYTGERRYGISQDIEYSLRIFQQMNLGVMAWAPTCASDAPANVRALHEFFAMAKFSSKHGQHELHSVEQAPYLVAGLQAILGSADALRSSYAYSLIYCPVAPLTHDGPMLDAYLQLGEYALPVMLMPMPVIGTTGPASLFSNIALANAEALSALVIFQLAHPGRPLIYSSATGMMDFRTGGYLAGVPEMGLQSAALVGMAKFYGLPSSSAGCTSDAKEAGPQAVIEKFITTLLPFMAGADIIIGTGEIESDQLLILEQIVVDNEIAALCHRMVDGIDASEDKDLFADIAQVGPGGHFLKARSTRSAARSGEFYMPKLFDHSAYESWLALGRPSMYSRARETVERILAEPVQDALPESVISQLDEILVAAEREIPT